jgi:hypothetical protein
VHSLNQIDWIEQIRLAGSGRTSANINPGHGSPATNDDAATGERLQVVGMSDLNPGNVCEAAALGACPR